jgi:tetratricopeptide (TPR) repeat protein
VPIDLLSCGRCSAAVAEEDWVPPLLPLLAGRCVNCGHLRDRDGVCASCGLNATEDAEVHDELRQIVAPAADLFEAAREATRQGRRLMALKLATAAAAFHGHDAARAFRVWLLNALGENQAALDDAKAWVENHPDPPVLAWSSLGQAWHHAGFPGAAADAFGKVLVKDPKLHDVRSRRSQILLSMRREGQAIDEALTVLDQEGVDERSADAALEVAEALASKFEEQLRNDEVARILEKSARYVGRSARLLAQRARLAAVGGDVAGAKKDLKAARRLVADLPEYQAVEKLMAQQRTSWWRW